MFQQLFTLLSLSQVVCSLMCLELIFWVKLLNGVGLHQPVGHFLAWLFSFLLFLILVQGQFIITSKYVNQILIIFVCLFVGLFSLRVQIAYFVYILYYKQSGLGSKSGHNLFVIVFLGRILTMPPFPGVQMGTSKINAQWKPCNGLASYLGAVTGILLAIQCHRNQDKIPQYGPVGLRQRVTQFIDQGNFNSRSRSLDSSTGLGHFVVLLDRTLYSHTATLTQMYYWQSFWPTRGWVSFLYFPLCEYTKLFLVLISFCSWYLQKFEDYPKSRKALIPFVL